MKTNFIFVLLSLFFSLNLSYAQMPDVNRAELANKNIVTNPGGESRTTGWSATGGSLTTVIGGSSTGSGKAAISWDSSASSQILHTKLDGTPNSIKGKNCLARFKYTGGGGADIRYSVDDGTNTLGGDVSSSGLYTISSAAASYTNSQDINFICPTGGSGTLRFSFASQGNANTIYIDDVYIGEAVNLTNVSQAQLYGSARFPGASSCNWSATQTSFADFSADSDCTFPAGSNLKGNAIAPATKIPAIKFSSLPPGEYLLVARGAFEKTSTTNDACFFRFSDGTISSETQSVSSATVSLRITTITGHLSYTTAQSNLTISVQAASDTAAKACGVVDDATHSDFTIVVYRFPTSSETAYRPNINNWKVDANISGALVSLGTSAVSSYTGIENGSLSLTNNSGGGNITAQIPCSSTNAPTGTTCAAGNESVGVSFTLPVAGDVLACVSFGHDYYTGASGTIYTAFQVVETPNTAQTISQEGKSRVNSANTTQNEQLNTPFRVCGNFSFASTGQKTLRLMYEQVVSGTVTQSYVIADALATAGQRDIHWEVYPITQNMPMPILVGSVTSNYTGAMRIESATVTPTSGSVCTTPINPGSWISSTTPNAVGDCTLTFAVPFSSVPVCAASSQGSNGAFDRYAYFAWIAGAPGTGSVRVRHSLLDGATALGSGTNPDQTAETLAITCIGPR